MTFFFRDGTATLEGLERFKERGTFDLVKSSHKPSGIGARHKPRTGKPSGTHGIFKTGVRLGTFNQTTLGIALADQLVDQTHTFLSAADDLRQRLLRGHITLGNRFTNHFGLSHALLKRWIGIAALVFFQHCNSTGFKTNSLRFSRGHAFLESSSLSKFPSQRINSTCNNSATLVELLELREQLVGLKRITGSPSLDCFNVSTELLNLVQIVTDINTGALTERLQNLRCILRICKHLIGSVFDQFYCGFLLRKFVGLLLCQLTLQRHCLLTKTTLLKLLKYCLRVSGTRLPSSFFFAR